MIKFYNLDKYHMNSQRSYGEMKNNNKFDKGRNSELITQKLTHSQSTLVYKKRPSSDDATKNQISSNSKLRTYLKNAKEKASIVKDDVRCNNIMF